MAEGLDSIRQAFNRLIDTDRVIGRAIFGVFDLHSQRIFEKGQDANLRTLSYKGKAFYLNFSDPKNAGKFARKQAPRGKKNKGDFKNGKKRKSTYFGGYADFKSDQGFGPKVNFTLTGRLKFDYKVIKEGELKYSFAVQNEQSADKMDGHESKEQFNAPIYQVSEQELELFDKLVGEEFERAFQ